MSTCTSINNFCPQCSHIFDSINRNRANRIYAEHLIRDDPDIYPVIFYFQARMDPANPRTAEDIAEEVEEDFHESLGKEIKVYRAISPKTRYGNVTFWYMVDFPMKGKIDPHAMEVLFRGERLDIRRWKVKKPTEGQCTSFARLCFFRDHYDYVEDLEVENEEDYAIVALHTSLDGAYLLHA